MKAAISDAPSKLIQEAPATNSAGDNRSSGISPAIPPYLQLFSKRSSTGLPGP